MLRRTLLFVAGVGVGVLLMWASAQGLHSKLAEVEREIQQLRTQLNRPSTRF